MTLSTLSQFVLGHRTLGSGPGHLDSILLTLSLVVLSPSSLHESHLNCFKLNYSLDFDKEYI